MIETKKYIRKPLYVDAVQVTAENISLVAEWCQGDLVHHNKDGTQQHIRVRVHNPKTPRQTKAYVGDWILYTERGYKVYLDKAFNNAFDLVDGDPEPIGEFTMDQIESAREHIPMVPVTSSQIESLEQ